MQWGSQADAVQMANCVLPAVVHRENSEWLADSLLFSGLRSTAEQRCQSAEMIQGDIGDLYGITYLWTTGSPLKELMNIKCLPVPEL